MNLRMTLLAASVVAALPMMTSNAAQAAAQLMSAPVAQSSPQESAGLVAKMAALDSQRGLSADHSFRIASQHPGVVGEKITRANHTYKGLRVFGSESVIVTNSAGDIVSESVADRRAALDAPAAAQ
ncbi:M4 family peptidase, partial [Rugamonas sp. FT82W]|nr:M4 family peptidase [Duganella vulcania]